MRVTVTLNLSDTVDQKAFEGAVIRTFTGDAEDEDTSVLLSSVEVVESVVFGDDAE